MVKTENTEKNSNDIDISKIVSRAQSFYGKNKGMASLLSTGKDIIKPSDETPGISWPHGDMWKKLTGNNKMFFGYCYEFSGKPDSGKSSCASVFMSQAQKEGHYVILWDAEGKFQKNRYDKYMGGNSDRLLIINTKSIVDGAKALVYFVNAIKEENKKSKIFIVLDSIGALLTRQDTNEDEELSNQPGVQAKEVGWMTKKIQRIILDNYNKETGEHSVCFLCVNQVYQQLMSPGLKEKGGETLFYAMSVIVQMARKRDLTKVRSGEKIKYGILSRAKIRKNHLFSGEDCVSELDIVVDASGVQLADDVKKKDKEVEGWDESETDSTE
jgi:hypothetical protein